MLIDDNAKKYPTPDSGDFIGVIADFIDLGQRTNQFGTKSKVRIVWILDKLDPENKPYRVQRTVNATISSLGPRPSELYNIVKEVMGTAPAVPFESEELIGRANKLFIIKEGEYANIKGILPLPPGAVIPTIPADFVRAKDRAQKPQVTSAAPAVAQPQQVQAAIATAAQAKPDVSF